MTQDRRYELAACDASSQKGLTLYEARKELLRARDLGHLGEASHIRRSGRCVGYYNLWTETVRPMFGAMDKERHVLSMWEGDRAKTWDTPLTHERAS